MSTQYETQRSVIDLRDIEDGSYKDANELLENTSEDQNAQIRSGLQIAQRSGIYKYVCAVCGQPLKLCSRRFDRRESWFFAHFPNSEDCPVKTESAYNPLRWAELWYNMFKESKLHKSITETLYRILSNSYEFSDVAKKKRILFPEITNEWRIPDVIAQYNNKTLVFEFQLYTTFLNTIIDRNSFYRLIGYEILWIFPYFTPSDQKLCEKDTYYSHRRNVFVFDTESYYTSKPNDDKPKLPFDKTNYKFAQEESLRRGTLMLNCYWQEPYILNEKLFFKWHHKLISIKELKYDEKTHDVFYIDSDQLFYDKADPKSKQLFDEWKEVKEKRWDKIFRDIKERTRLSMLSEEDRIARDNQREENKRKINIINKARNGEIELQLFSNNRSENEEDNNGNPLPDLWGYKYDDLVIIEPRYEDAKPFIGSVAPVKTKKKGHWGAINMEGKKVIQFQYDTIIPVTSYCFVVSKDRKYGCINQNGEEIIPFKYGKMAPIGTSCLLVDTGWSDFKKFWNGTWYDGSWEYHKGDSLAIDLKGNELFKVSGTDVRVINDFIICGGSYFSFLLFDPTGKKLHDYVFYSCEIINDNIVVSRMIEKERKYGILTDNGKDYLLPIVYDNIEPINEKMLRIKKEGKYAYAYSDKAIELSEFLYDSIEILSDSYIKVQQNGKYGLCNITMCPLLECEYENIVVISNDYMKVRLGGKWILYNSITRSLSPNYYYDIKYEESNNRLYAYQDYGHFGDLSPNGFPITYKESQLPNGLCLYKRLGYCGVMEEDGKDRISCEYDEITYFEEINGFRVLMGKKYGLVNIMGLPICDLIYDRISKYNDGVAEVVKKDSYRELVGHIDTKGNVIIDNVSNIMPNRFIGRKLGKYALLDNKKKPITDFLYESINSLSDRFYIVEVIKDFASSRLGILDLNVKPLLDTEYLQIEFEKDHFLAKDNNGLWGCYDTSGKLLIDHLYKIISVYNNSYFMAEKDVSYGRVYTLYTFDGKQLSIPDCTSIEQIDDNLFKYSKNGVGVFDSDGKDIIPNLYGSLIYRDGYYYVTKSGHDGILNRDGSVKVGQSIHITDSIIAKEKFGVWGLYDNKDQELIEDHFASVTILNDRLVGVSIKKDRRVYYGILNHNMVYVQPTVYDEIVVEKECIKGLFDDRWYQINDEGTIIPTIIQLSNNTQLTSEREKCFIRDEHGNIIKEYDFVCEETFKYGYAVVKNRTRAASYSKTPFNYTYGLINTEGNILLPVEYKHIKILNKYYFLASKGNGGGLIDSKGKVLIPYAIIYIGGHLEKELTHSFIVSMHASISRKYITWNYFKNNKVSERNHFYKIRFDFKNGLPDYLHDDWKDLLDIENENIDVIDGTIVKIGYDVIFVNIKRKKTGWLYKAQYDYLNFHVGDRIKVKIDELDWEKGRVLLTLSQ